MSDLEGKRIVLASFIPDRPWTGMGKWSHRIAEGLESLGARPSLWFEDDFPHTARLGRLAVLGAPAAVARRIVRERASIDAVILHEPLGACYGVMRAGNPSLPPMIVMCHNAEPRVFGTMLHAARMGWADVPWGSRIKTPLFRLWQSFIAYLTADHMLCLSSGDAAFLSRLRPGRVTHFSNGVNAEHFHPVFPGERAATRVLFVGGWLDVKGRRVLPPLWRRVRSARADATLTLIGTGAAAADVTAEFAECDRGSLRVIPKLEQERDVVRQFAEHDVLVMPSLSEGSPLVLLEAMSAGLPVAAANVGGIPDVATHGQEALLFDPLDPGAGSDALLAVLADGALRTRLARAARLRAESCTWRHAAAAVAAGVRTAIGEAR